MPNYPRMVSTNQRLLKRSCESLIGISTGLLADRELSDNEILFLDTWLKENYELCNTWPGEVVHARVREVLADGVITESEREYLSTTLSELIGGGFQETGAVSGGATALPLDLDVDIQISGRLMCFTGEFLFGTRTACVKATESRGGFFHPRVTKKLDYLVIGGLASHEWAHTSHGRKIEKAMEYKSDGIGIAVIGEEAWVQALA